MWQDILLILIVIYLARQWYLKNWRRFHGKPILVRHETKDGGFVFTHHGYHRWSGIRRLFSEPSGSE